jgi:hypothetical protein
MKILGSMHIHKIASSTANRQHAVILPAPHDADKARLFNESSGNVYRYYYGPLSGAGGSNWTFQYSEIEKTLGLGYDLS